MSGDDKYPKNSARLLVSRERELHAMKRKQARLARWLRLAQSLPAVVDPKKTVEDSCASVSDLMIATLDLQCVLFSEWATRIWIAFWRRESESRSLRPWRSTAARTP